MDHIGERVLLDYIWCIRKKAKLISLFIILLLLVTGISDTTVLAVDSKLQMKEQTANETVTAMRLGWNLGNTLDAYSVYDAGATEYQLVAYYLDGSAYQFSMCDAVAFEKSPDGKTMTAVLSWDMKNLLSANQSSLHAIGFQIWNFSDGLIAGTSLSATVSKAALSINGKSYSLDGLKGDHSVIMNEKGTGSFETKRFPDGFTKTEQLKEGTLLLTVSLPITDELSKQEYFETCWGNPVTDTALFAKIKASGFQAVRLPVTWVGSMNEDGIVEEERMARVEVLVNAILDAGMYCIINLHHDTAYITDAGSGWLKADTSDPLMAERFQKLWQQIAKRFEPYGNRLLFEGFNEILVYDVQGNSVWDYPGKTATAAVNELNQIFVDTVRATGGNNKTRCLVVNTYAASTDQKILDDFVLPSDSADNRLIVEVHDYSPMDFSWTDITWAASRTTFGTNADHAMIEGIFERLKERFVGKGIPVILGEFSSCNKTNTSERMQHANYVVATAKKAGIVCFWWDNGGEFESSKATYDGAGLINRRTQQWEYKDIVNSMVVVTQDRVVISSIKSIENNITLTWKKCNTATKYQILYSYSKTGTYKSAGVTSKLTFQLNGLQSGQKVYVKVRAYILKGTTRYYGTASTIQSIMIP